MATLRFGMTTFASRMMTMEAVVRVMTECFGRKSVSAVGVSEKSCDVKLSTQVKQLQNEAVRLKARFMQDLIPVAGAYQAFLIDHVKQSATLYAPEEMERIMSRDNDEIEKISAHITSILYTIEEMMQQCKAADALTDERSVLWVYTNTISYYMRILYTNAEELQRIIK